MEMNIKAAVKKTIENIGSGEIEPGVTYLIGASGRADMTAATVAVRDHSFIADVNPLLGGFDLAPCPAEYLLGALGACIKTSCIINGALMGIDLGAIRIEVSGFADRRGTLGLEAGIPVGFQKIEYRLKLESRDTQEKIQHLIERVERLCHLINTIRRPIDIEGHFEIVNGYANESTFGSL
jgi:uncharacterized OsmC-like protein